MSRNLYILKFESKFIKQNKFNINMSFNEALDDGFVVQLSDSEILRTIRRLTNHELDFDEIEDLYLEKDKLRNKQNTKENRDKLKEIKSKIYDKMYMPKYISVVMNNNSQYDRLYQKGFIFNGSLYKRGTSSAPMGKKSIVVFINDEIRQDVINVLNNGRNTEVDVLPSKLTAYMGLATSATKIMNPQPRVAVVSDYYIHKKLNVNFCTETDEWHEDIIEVKEIDKEFNCFDGMGVCDFSYMQKVSKNLCLDYTPSSVSIRNSFIKGQVVCMDFVDFCEKENNGSYKSVDIYGNTFNINEVDIILTESQFKGAKWYKSFEEYEANCIKNHLFYGVSVVCKEKLSDVAYTNYQFLQTLKDDLTDDEIAELCSQTEDFFKGINSNVDNLTLKFLLGKKYTDIGIENFISSSDNYWVKALLVNHDLIKDKFIKEKIQNLIKIKLDESKVGRLIINANFQMICSDPFALMQHICGQKVTGLLLDGEFYSEYWSNKGIDKIATARSPLTYFGEHLVCDLKYTEKQRYWYKHLSTSLICNIYGSHTMNWSGADFDGDIVFTTNNRIFIERTYKNLLMSTYETPPSKKYKIEYDDDAILQEYDKFSFGSKIGAITNRATSCVTLMSCFAKNSEEYNALFNRVVMACSHQSKEIDRSKNGWQCKNMKNNWIKYQKIDNEKEYTEEELQKIKFENSILVDKHPYFFRYLYKHTNSKYKTYYKQKTRDCRTRYNLTIEELYALENKSQSQLEFLNKYENYMPIINSDCVMNRVCRYMEKVHADIKSSLKFETDEFIYRLYLNDYLEFDEDLYIKLENIIRTFIKSRENRIVFNDSFEINQDYLQRISKEYEILNDNIFEVSNDMNMVTNCLIIMFYQNHKSWNKSILWDICGDVICRNLMVGEFIEKNLE